MNQTVEIIRIGTPGSKKDPVRYFVQVGESKAIFDTQLEAANYADAILSIERKKRGA